MRHTQHRGHDSHASVLLVLVRPADAEVVDGVQTERVEPGGDVLGSHDEGRSEDTRNRRY